jgi:hypothetical protein
MNQDPENIVQTTLDKLLREKLELFKKAEKERRPITELNAIYQQIKVLRHKIVISQPAFTAFRSANTTYTKINK